MPGSGFPRCSILIKGDMTEERAIFFYSFFSCFLGVLAQQWLVIALPCVSLWGVGARCEQFAAQKEDLLLYCQVCSGAWNPLEIEGAYFLKCGNLYVCVLNCTGTAARYWNVYSEIYYIFQSVLHNYICESLEQTYLCIKWILFWSFAMLYNKK